MQMEGITGKVAGILLFCYYKNIVGRRESLEDLFIPYRTINIAKKQIISKHCNLGIVTAADIILI